VSQEERRPHELARTNNTACRNETKLQCKEAEKNERSPETRRSDRGERPYEPDHGKAEYWGGDHTTEQSYRDTKRFHERSSPANVRAHRRAIAMAGQSATLHARPGGARG